MIDLAGYAVTAVLLVANTTCSATGAGLDEKVLIIGIDGVRPDALQVAVTPNLDGLVADGAVSYEAQTGDITSSGPSWSSMLTGVWRDKHGVDDNSFNGSNYGQYPHFFTRLKEIRPDAYTTSIVNWTPINTQIVSDADFTLSGLSDTQVSAQAAAHIAGADPDVVFLHFDDVDAAGHACCYDPENANYLAAIETADARIGPVLDAIVNRPTYAQEDWLIIASTDHGGTGTGHGLDIPEHRTIFVIVSGPSACAGTIVPAPGIVDVAATALAHFGPIDPAWDLDGVQVGISNCISGTCHSSLTAGVEVVAGTVTLSWLPAVDIDAAGYEVRRNGDLVATLGLASTGYVDTPPTGPQPDHEIFDYEVSTVGGGEGGLCAGLEARVVISTGDVRFADDFEAYGDDVDLQSAGWRIVDVNEPVEDSAWTLSNPGGRGNPPLFDGSASGGSFLISDSDIGGLNGANPTGSGMSHDVWSPTFDCTGLDPVVLHLDCSAVLNNNGKAVFDVDVTTNGGQSWTNVFRRVAPARTEAPPFVTTENADGFFGRLDVDLSPVAAGAPAVRFRVRHFEPSWDWWIAIDDVIVDDVDLASGGTETLLPSEDFASGIPVTWTVAGLNGGADTWTTTDPCVRSIETAGASFPYQDGRGVHRLGVDFAILDSACDPDPAEDELLITPAVDCTDAAAVYLHYRSEIVNSGAATEGVLLSLDGGATYLPAPLFSYSGGGLAIAEEPVFAERVIRAPAAAGEANVTFAFRYASGGNQWWWAVDDVRVTGVPFAPSDIDHDGDVDFNDLLIVLATWGPCPDPPAECPADIDGDGDVGFADLLQLLAGWS